MTWWGISSECQKISVLKNEQEEEARGRNQSSQRLEPATLDSLSIPAPAPLCLTSSILSIPICKMEIAIVATTYGYHEI